MALSKSWTLKDFFRRAQMDLGLGPNTKSYQDRVLFTNSAIEATMTPIFPLVARAYFDSASLTPSTTAKTDMATYSAGQLTLSAVSLTSADVGKMIVFIDGSSNVYGGIVDGVTSNPLIATVSIVTPPSDGTAGTVYIVATVTTSPVSLANLRIARIGNPKWAHLESSVVPQKNIKHLPYDEFLGFRASSSSNQDNIVYSVLGELMYLNHGTNITSYGTLVYHYARLPIPVVNDTDYIDVPDGAPCEIALIKLKQIIAFQEKLPPMDYTRDLAILEGTLSTKSEVLKVQDQQHEQKQERL